MVDTFPGFDILRLNENDYISFNKSRIVNRFQTSSFSVDSLFEIEAK